MTYVATIRCGLLSIDLISSCRSPAALFGVKESKNNPQEVKQDGPNGHGFKKVRLLQLRSAFCLSLMKDPLQHAHVLQALHQVHMGYRQAGL